MHWPASMDRFNENFESRTLITNHYYIITIIYRRIFQPNPDSQLTKLNLGLADFGGASGESKRDIGRLRDEALGLGLGKCNARTINRIFVYLQAAFLYFLQIHI